jgi:hypothetical protein
MTAAELGTKTIAAQGPLVQQKMFFITGTAATGVADFCTCTGLTTVHGAYFQGADGTVPVLSMATNVVTFGTGATAQVYHGFVWGV